MATSMEVDNLNVPFINANDLFQYLFNVNGNFGVNVQKEKNINAYVIRFPPSYENLFINAINNYKNNDILINVYRLQNKGIYSRYRIVVSKRF